MGTSPSTGTPLLVVCRLLKFALETTTVSPYRKSAVISVEDFSVCNASLNVPAAPLSKVSKPADIFSVIIPSVVNFGVTESVKPTSLENDWALNDPPAA